MVYIPKIYRIPGNLKISRNKIGTPHDGVGRKSITFSSEIK